MWRSAASPTWHPYNPFMTQVPSAQNSIVGYRLGLPARLAILGALFIAEKMLLNVFVDFDRAQEAQGLGAFVRVAQHWGFRFLVALAAAVALFTYVRGWQSMQAVDASVKSAPIRVRWLLAHFALVALLAPLSYALYRY